VNAVLALPHLPPRLSWSARRYARELGPLATNRDLLRQLTEAGAELLVSAPADRLRRCAGAGCVLLFLDVSKSGQRRWCSMAGCGNRAKVRAHYQRQRG
jgi:predicted RNA-binding Zn ribbon-like protein